MSARVNTTQAAGQGRRWSSVGEETFVGGMWVLYILYRFAGRLPFRVKSSIPS